ncbi:conserved hypothetical protein [Roseibium sp. TrichSKD4]|uniref:hypothetical protein n=1 Tax=Roseibium sp. TrichSKD4 TaxID=744980 RepID=UPI0001E56456|nr:hypothetical protein [Roseibium sp. TrichSKD4]EFO34133.1 conserved hypothetical protein [Roseibium sp. TrichSKD4]
MTTAMLLVMWVQYYLYVGAGVALVFLLFGMDRIDASAHGSYAFRPLLIPGICLLWPLVLYRWLQLERAQSSEEGKAK